MIPMLPWHWQNFEANRYLCWARSKPLESTSFRGKRLCLRFFRWPGAFVPMPAIRSRLPVASNGEESRFLLLRTIRRGNIRWHRSGSRASCQRRIPQENIAIKPNDVISVPKGDIIYVIGAVHKPGGFMLGENESLGAPCRYLR